MTEDLLFDGPDVSTNYMLALNMVDELRSELYALQRANQPVEALIDMLFDFEEELLKHSD